MAKRSIIKKLSKEQKSLFDRTPARRWNNI